ncbi:MAG: glutathione synthase [Candidatus Accumulibacter sp.]|jgi:glutathione synthase|nr:glutathione synthase [Accumulibacter sp.]
MRFAFILDPLESLKAYKDSSIALMRAARNAGHEVWCLHPQAIFWSETDGVCAEAVRLDVRDDDAHWFSRVEHSTLSLSAFSAVVVRKDPPFDIEYVTMTWLLERAEAEGARVFNRPRALRDHSEKLATLEFRRFSVPMIVARAPALIHAFVDAQRDVILKPLDGMGGSRIFRVRADDPNRNVIVETLTCDAERTIIAQRYIPGIVGGDKRILLINGQVIPYGLARIPKAGETRANLAAGGTGIARKIDAHEREIAEALAPVLAARGLFLVGLDVIGGYLTEVNVTSPTCMVEITAQTGFNVAGVFIEALEKECASPA